MTIQNNQEEKALSLPCIYLSIEPNSEQVEALKSLNKRMRQGVSILVDELVKKDAQLQKRLLDDADPLVDYEFEAESIFYHKDTEEIIATNSYIFGKYFSIEEDRASYYRDDDFAFLYRMRNMGDEHISAWFGYLLGYNKLKWYDLLNIGEISFELNIQYQYQAYINDEPSEDDE